MLFKYYFLTKINILRQKYLKFNLKRHYITRKKKSVASIHRIDDKQIPVDFSEIRLFAIMRNESLRLPHFLKYYNELGVDRFFIIDNSSEDASQSIAMKEPNLHLFYTNDSYKNHWFWMEDVLERYGLGCWCFVVDIDELFMYPHRENFSLIDFILFLKSSGCNAVKSLLLDLYPKTCIDKVHYSPGDDPMAVIPYFDAEFRKVKVNFFNWKIAESFLFETYVGGVRERIFGSNFPSHLSKISLFCYSQDTYLTQGMHAISNAIISDCLAVTFHTKFLPDFVTRAKQEALRGEHFADAIVYKIFENHIAKEANLNFFYEQSIKFLNTEQLIKLRIMSVSTQFKNHFKDLEIE